MNLYIDPGKFHAGIALFNARALLVGMTVLKVEAKSGADASRALGEEARRWVGSRSITRIACERPSVWTKGGGRGSANDILDLMATNGAILHAVTAQERAYITTNDWKGQVSKEITEYRVRKRLNIQELAVLNASTYRAIDHNAIDAVGIGLWDLKRM